MEQRAAGSNPDEDPTVETALPGTPAPGEPAGRADRDEDRDGDGDEVCSEVRNEDLERTESLQALPPEPESAPERNEDLERTESLRALPPEPGSAPQRNQDLERTELIEVLPEREPRPEGPERTERSDRPEQPEQPQRLDRDQDTNRPERFEPPLVEIRPEPIDEAMLRTARAATAAAESADGFEPAAAEARRSGPRRWLVVGGVAVTALALATTAAALATRGSSTSAPDAAAAKSPAATSTTAEDATPDPATSSSAAPTTPAATTATTTPAPSPTTTKKTTAPTTTAPTTSSTGTGADCEDVSHDTPADEAVKFSGMTHGTQAAFTAAKADAQKAGLQFVLNSGYRSAAYQQRIFDCWVKALGSPTAARKYALPPNQSAHVAGYAMDIAPPSAASWLESTAGKYGLCRRYVDEPWHFEYQSRYKTAGCPALLNQPE